MFRRLLVTGGAGFIGSHLVDYLIAMGYEVHVLDNFSTGCIANLTEAKKKGKVHIFSGNILNMSDVQQAMENVDGVFHLAVECVRRSLGYPIENHHINATGSLNVLEAARQKKIKRFLYCSSSEIYGNSNNTLLTEANTVCAPTTVYGAAKLVGEHYSKAYYCTYGLPAMVVRPFNAYGPRAHTLGDLAEVIPRFVIRLLNDLPPVIFGDGKNGRDFTYVTDVARGLATAFHCEALIGREINIAYGRCVSVNEVAEKLRHICGKPTLTSEYHPARPGDVYTLHADTRLARETLDYSAKIPFEEGLQFYLNWFKTHYPDPSVLLEENPINWQLESS